MTDDDLIAELGPLYFERDFMLSGLGDLATDNQDLLAGTWVDNLNASLLRRLNTPYGAIASSVWGVEGVLVLNATYGNKAFRLLSEPRTAGLVGQLKAGILECLAAEDRMVVTAVTTRFTADAPLPLLVYDISYQIAGTQVFQTLSLGADATSGLFIEVVG